MFCKTVQCGSESEEIIRGNSVAMFHPALRRGLKASIGALGKVRVFCSSPPFDQAAALRQSVKDETGIINARVDGLASLMKDRIT